MALSVRCRCGNTYELKDEYAGRLIRCPKCQAVSRAERAAYTPASQADPVFDRDIFLFAQQSRGASDPHTVSDESGTPIALVDVPEGVARGRLALVVGSVVMLLLIGTVLRHGVALWKGLGPSALVVGGGLAALLVLHLAAVALRTKGDVVLHRHERKRDRLLEIIQDRSLQLVATYTLRDAAGQPIARLRRNLLNALRRRWEVRTLADHLAFVATEPSLFHALRCRVLCLFHRLARTHVVVYAHGGRGVLGEFTSDGPSFDRYVLDLRRDRHRKLDRRVALALGVMLDLGEERRRARAGPSDGPGKSNSI